jgi:hypothetical protein
MKKNITDKIVFVALNGRMQYLFDFYVIDDDENDEILSSCYGGLDALFDARPGSPASQRTAFPASQRRGGIPRVV